MALPIFLGAWIAACQTPPSGSSVPSGQRLSTVSVDGYPMTFVQAGTGPTVVLVHGAAADHRFWNPQLESPAQGQIVALSKDFRVVAVSLRHHFPQQRDEPGATYSVAQHTSDLIRFIEQVQSKAPVHLVGHGRGGRVALEVARARPELVGKLVLVEPAIDSLLASEQGAETELAQQADVVEQRLRSGDVDGALAAYLDASSGEGSWKAMPEAAKQVARANVSTLAAAMREQSGTIGCAEFASLKAPVLLVGGEMTRPRQMRTLAEVAKCMPRAERVVVAKAGHRVSVDNPIGFNDAVTRFLKQ